MFYAINPSNYFISMHEGENHHAADISGFEREAKQRKIPVSNINLRTDGRGYVVKLFYR